MGEYRIVAEYQMTNEERLELFNIHLRRQLLESDYQRKLLELDQEQAKVVAPIEARLKIRLADCRLDYKTGKAFHDPQGVAHERQEKGLPP